MIYLIFMLLLCLNSVMFMYFYVYIKWLIFVLNYEWYVNLMVYYFGLIVVKLDFYSDEKI